MAPNQSRNLRRVLAGVAGIAVIGSVIWFAADWFQERKMKRRTNAYLTDIVTVLRLSETPDFHQRIDKVRTFINEHSIHRADDEAFRANQGQEGAFAAGILAHARGLSTEPAHMECSTRSTLMTRILHTLGYDTRIIAIFDSGTNLESHSFLEVMNPQTGQWETQDPDYDIYWRRQGAGERISLADMAEAIGDIEPCGRHSCGWDHVSREGIPVKRLMDYLDIISITAKQKTVRYSLYTSRAD